MNFHDLMYCIHDSNIWEHVKYQKQYATTPPGWGDADYFFSHILDAFGEPSLVVEVGSWLGRSTLAMHRELNKRGWRTPIVCIDTWLGSPEMWTDKKQPERWAALKTKCGYPTIYHEFARYIKANGAHGRVVPLPLDSASASIVLRDLGLAPSHVFLDGNHYEAGIATDLELWSRSDRVIMGDDYGEGEGWPAIKRCVDRMFGDRVETIDRYWWVEP